MNRAGMTAQTSAIEALILEKFKTEPFHNLRLLYGNRLMSPIQGGTCSDKTLSFLNAAKLAGFDVSLHSGFIDGREIHRLARVCIDGRLFFADVGNGWPALRLYPADREISYRCFGMGFRTEISGPWVTVFHEKNGRESQQLEINTHGRPESEILADISRRFNSGVVYPFSNSLRFSMLVGNKFLFLRGERLEIYRECGFDSVRGISEAEVPAMLLRYFGYKIPRLRNND